MTRGQLFKAADELYSQLKDQKTLNKKLKAQIESLNNGIWEIKKEKACITGERNAYQKYYIESRQREKDIAFVESAEYGVPLHNFTFTIAYDQKEGKFLNGNQGNH